MQNRPVLAAVAAAVTLTIASVAQATPPAPLEGRTLTGAAVAANDPSAVFEYDPNLNITWLRNWDVNNYGFLSWSTAEAWASGLTPATVGAFTGGWSLPSSLNEDGTGPCAGLSCTGSQMGYMYYVELGNPAGGPMSNTGPFQNVQGSVFWSKTETPDSMSAWVFGTATSFLGGGQLVFPKSWGFAAEAVRPGDVLTPVPEPQSLAMMLAGLGVLGALGRRRQC